MLQEQLQHELGDDFVIERELGGGGMSRVFVATDRRLGRRVVVKLLRPELSAGVSVERFRREILTAASLQHPLIVPVLDTGQLNGLPYFLMPFVEGESLRSRLHRGPLTVLESVRILRDVARALAVAHARGIVHRDIKPDNVLLANDAAVVADFGVSKALADARHSGDANDIGDDAITTAGVSLGTPAYMAPEQAAADPSASFPVDIYAVGVLAYEMLTGAPPFTDRSPQQIMAAHITEAPVPVQRRRAGIPGALATLVMHCLEKDAGHRPANAAALVAALEDPQVLSGSFTPVDREGGEIPSARTDRSVSGRRLRIGVAASVGVIVIVITTLALRQNRGSARDSTASPISMMTGAPEDSVPSVAVLPFVFLGADTSQAYAAEAVTGAITDALSQVDGLRVTSRGAAEALQRRIAAGDTARLPVRTLVEGVVEAEGDRIRLTLRLVGTSDGFTIYADRVEGRRGNIFALEDEVARAMRARLRAHFGLPTPPSEPS